VGDFSSLSINDNNILVANENGNENALGVYYCNYNLSSGWGSVSNLPNNYPGESWVTINSNNNNILVTGVYSVGILYSIYNSITSQWNNLSIIQGATTEDWSGVSINNNNVLVGCSTYNGNLFYSTYNSTTLQWSNLIQIQGSSSENWTSVSINDNNVLCACSNIGVYYSTYNLNSNSWSNFTLLSSSSQQNWTSTSINDNNVLCAGSESGIVYSIGTAPTPAPAPSPSPAPTPAPAPSPAPSPSSSKSPIIKSYPNPIIAGEPATIIYESFNSNTYPVNGQMYVLRNNLDLYVSDIFQAGPNETTYTFYNVILTSGMNTLSIYNITTGATITTINENAESTSSSMNLDVSSICFKEGTKILCNINNQEKYIPIEQLDDKIFVKTYKHGCKKVKFVLKSKIINSKEKTINKLYVMKKSETNNLIEDLYVTGSHALLKDELTEKQVNRMNKLIEKINIKYDMKIDDKYKIIACFDKRFQEFNEPGYFNIYHLVLEAENEIFKNYGIYANGILAESTDEITLSRMKDYKLINLEYDDTKEKEIIRSQKEKEKEIIQLEKEKLDKKLEGIKKKIEKEKEKKIKQDELLEKEIIQLEKIQKLEKEKIKLEKEKTKLEKEKTKLEKEKKKKNDKLLEKEIVPENMLRLKKKYKNAIIE
jgi:hypothetical protein